MQNLRQKGVDYDVDGDISTLEELVAIGGLMPLKDVRDRIPISYMRLRSWYVKDDPVFGKCFCNPFKHEGTGGRGTVYVDVRELNSLISGIITGKGKKSSKKEQL